MRHTVKQNKREEIEPLNTVLRYIFCAMFGPMTILISIFPINEYTENPDEKCPPRTIWMGRASGAGIWQYEISHTYTEFELKSIKKMVGGSIEASKKKKSRNTIQRKDLLEQTQAPLVFNNTSLNHIWFVLSSATNGHTKYGKWPIMDSAAMMMINRKYVCQFSNYCIYFAASLSVLLLLWPFAHIYLLLYHIK